MVHELAQQGNSELQGLGVAALGERQQAGKVGLVLRESACVSVWISSSRMPNTRNTSVIREPASCRMVWIAYTRSIAEADEDAIEILLQCHERERARERETTNEQKSKKSTKINPGYFIKVPCEHRISLRCSNTRPPQLLLSISLSSQSLSCVCACLSCSRSLPDLAATMSVSGDESECTETDASSVTSESPQALPPHDTDVTPKRKRHHRHHRTTASSQAGDGDDAESDSGHRRHHHHHHHHRRKSHLDLLGDQAEAEHKKASADAHADAAAATADVDAAAVVPGGSGVPSSASSASSANSHGTASKAADVTSSTGGTSELPSPAVPLISASAPVLRSSPSEDKPERHRHKHRDRDGKDDDKHKHRHSRHEKLAKSMPGRPSSPATTSVLDDLEEHEGRSLDDEHHDQPIDRVGPSSFERIQLIGRGDVGRVYLVRKKPALNEAPDAPPQLYAMKVLNKKEMISRNKVKRALTEREILATTNHPFIVTLYHRHDEMQPRSRLVDWSIGANVSVGLVWFGWLVLGTACDAAFNPKITSTLLWSTALEESSFERSKSNLVAICPVRRPAPAPARSTFLLASSSVASERD